MVFSGVRSSVLSQYFQCSVRSVQRLQKKFDQIGSLQDRKRTGRPLSTTVRQRRAIVRHILSDSFLPAAEAAFQHHHELSDEFWRKRKLVVFDHIMGLILTRLQTGMRLARLAWARSEQHCTEAAGTNMLITDECRLA